MAKDGKDGKDNDSSSDEEGEGQGGKGKKDGSGKVAIKTEGPRITVRLRGLPFSATEENILEFLHPLEPVAIRMTKNKDNLPSGRWVGEKLG